MAGPPYITVSQVRDAGLTDPPYSDAAITAAIALWQAVIEEVTRQWFYSRAVEWYLDGTDAAVLHFHVPIIDIEEVRLNGSTTPLDATLYRVYNTTEDRRNPRIKLVDAMNNNLDIFTAPMVNGRLIFRKGRQNQYVRGHFGYLEDGGVPLPIQRALLLLVIEKLTTPIYGGSSSGSSSSGQVGPVIEEGTDGHYVKYAQVGGTVVNRRASPLDGFTNNPEVKAILRLYRGPVPIAAPAHASYL